ncbi:MAG: transglycosylase SLT domain-containing protein [Candidatus Manganitrophaceae bacterium]
MNHKKGFFFWIVLYTAFYFLPGFFVPSGWSSEVFAPPPEEKRLLAADLLASPDDSSDSSNEPSNAETSTTDPVTPLEVIELEEHLPEDFFDLLALDFPTAPSFSTDGISSDPFDPSIKYDVPIVYNDLVQEYVLFFQTRLRDKFELWLARSGRYVTLMQEILREHQMPEDLVFLALIESGFNPKAYSRAKAAGPWQFITATGKRYGLKIDQWVDERRDPIKSTVAAAKYLKDLYELFSSWPLSMASYNAGEGKIMRAMARTKADDFWDLKHSGYIRPETKNYVPKYMAATIIARNPRQYGFFVDPHPPLTYDEVSVARGTSFKTISKATGITIAELKAYNPELKKEMIPPNAANYRLKLPSGARETFLVNFSGNPLKEMKEVKTAKAVKGSDSPKIQKHRIRKGETLHSIARKYDTTIGQLLRENELDQEIPIKAGHYLTIPTQE